jgi:hypothetical protein
MMKRISEVLRQPEHRRPTRGSIRGSTNAKLGARQTYLKFRIKRSVFGSGKAPQYIQGMNRRVVWA